MGPTDFVDAVLACQSPSMVWPTITEPGLPNFVMGCFAANMAGITYILDFIPPTPTKLPSLPSINLFLDPFMGAIKMPSSYPSLNLSLGGISIPIPGVGGGEPEFDVSGMLKMIAVCAALPFLLIKNMIEKLLNLQIVLPTLGGTTALLGGLFAEANLTTPAITTFTGCLAKSTVGLFTSMIPA